VDNGIAPFTLESVEATPANGVSVHEDYLQSPFRVRWYVNGVFTPNKNVALYSYDRYRGHGDRGFVLMARLATNSSGHLPGNDWPNNRTRFSQKECPTGYYNKSNAPIIVVDEGAGTVSNAGRTTAPWSC
jgi:hypothetical protein